MRISLGVAIFTLVASSVYGGDQKTASSRRKPSHATVQDGVFRSESLQREMHYRVLLPSGYENSSRRYPALFLLHGLFGDYQNWTTRTELIRWAEGLELIIAMPDAEDSWYVNSATNPADRFEDYIAKDFVAEIDGHYRTIREGYARAIAGLSMGGYAAIKLALRYPEAFAYAGGISAALNAPDDLDEKVEEFRESLRKAFGPAGDPARGQNDVYLLVAPANAAKLPYFYVDCGTNDMFLEPNRKFVAGLPERKIAYEYHEMPGGHDWNYWDGAIRRFLGFLRQSKLMTNTLKKSSG